MNLLISSMVGSDPDYDQGKEKFLIGSHSGCRCNRLHPVKISFGNINDNLYTEANFSIQVSYGNKTSSAPDHNTQF